MLTIRMPVEYKNLFDKIAKTGVKNGYNQIGHKDTSLKTLKAGGSQKYLQLWPKIITNRRRQ